MVILKIFIGIGIIGICTYIGNIKSKKLRDREYILREMVTFLGHVENEIKYMMSILPNAYESSRQRLTTRLKDVVGQIVVDMLDLDNYDNIEKNIVDHIATIDGLTEYDKNIISSVFKNLGRSNVEGQIGIIQNAVTILNNQIKEANEIKLSSSKLYRTVGVISGIMIVIVFI